MFGLTVPISKTPLRQEFDSVHTILSNSVYKDVPSTWPCRTDHKGHILYLEVSDGRSSRKSSDDQLCVCGAAHTGFSTDDTGYGTDTDIDVLDTSQHSTKKDEHSLSSFSKSVLHKNRSSRKHRQNTKESTDLQNNQDSFCTCGIDDLKDEVDFLNMENLRQVSLKLNVKNVASNAPDKSKKVGHVGRALCKSLLGIVPGHFKSGDYKGHQNGLRLCVRGLVHDGPASKNPNIHIGDCLRLVNGREVTWDNIDDVFTSLTLLESKKVRIVLQDVSRMTTVLVREKVSTDEESLVRLVTGLCFDSGTEESGETTLYSVIYLDTEKLKSEENVHDEDLVYLYPRHKELLPSLRGCFFTLYQLLADLSESAAKTSSLLYQGEIIHVGYHKEESGLLLVMYSNKTVRPLVLPSLVTDMVRVLRVQYGSVPEAFSTKDNIQELDNFFSLFHHSLGIHTPSTNSLRNHSRDTGAMKSLSCFDNVQYLPLYTSFKEKIEKIVTSFEASDFVDMSDSYYGCRRSYTVLGSCLFYKAQLLCSHLPRNDLYDIYLYLRYHNLLYLSRGEGIDQLVMWREVYPTRQWYDLGEEQMFGYTEPVAARWFWLLVGYKHSVFCVLLETGGCTTKQSSVCMPDPFYIDQCKATLMQIIALGLPIHCDTHYSSPLETLTCPVDQRLPHTSPLKSSLGDVASPLRRRVPPMTRKDSIHSDVSSASNSSGGSGAKKTKAAKMRLFPADFNQEKDGTQDQTTSKNIKLTVGAENCLFHFLHIDKIDGVYISPSYQGQELDKEITHNFHACSTHIKHMFDKYRYRKKYPSRDDTEMNFRIPSCPDSSFYHIREEGVLFHLPQNGAEQKVLNSYWVIGRQRSRTELYVCFQDNIPQSLVELAFRIGFGLQV